jgi:hypothetical protein
MSLGVNDDALLERAVETAFQSGIPIAVAAGNDKIPVRSSVQPAPCMYVCKISKPDDMS